MTLLEKLTEAKDQLSEIKAAVETGEKSADDLAQAIENVKAAQANVDAADQADELIKSLGTNETDTQEEENMEYKSIGEHVAAHVKEAGINPKQKFNYTAPAFKTAAPMLVPSGVKPAITDYDKNVYGARRPLLVADLFSTERIASGALTFFVESATVEGGPAYTTEGGTKPMMSFGDPTPVTVALQKIASHMKESDEMIEDAQWLADAINGRGLYQHELEVENYLVTALAGTSGIGTGSKLTPDGLFNAMMTVQTNSGFAADAIVLNPTDYANIRLRKDSNGQYYGGGFMYNGYGNGDVVAQPSIWGVPTIITPAVAAGTAFVGAFKAGASVVRKNNGVVVDIANQNEDDFIKNLITILIEERLALAVRRPSAFVKITGSSTSTEA